MFKDFKWPTAVVLLSLICATPLMAQDAQRGQTLYEENNCMMCHGNVGQGVVSQNGPRIGGQHDWYILTSLNAFKGKERENPEMYPYIQALSEQDFKDLAAFVSTLSGMEEEE